MKHLMVDLETMGMAPNGAIMAIGAVPFCPEERRLADEKDWFYEKCSLEANVGAGREIDPDTVEWWLKQDSRAQMELLSGDRCWNFETFIRRFDGYLEYKGFEFIWAKPPSFDVELLKSAFEKLHLWFPWDFRSVRCVKTQLTNLTQEVSFKGTPHIASHDAAHQARQVICSYDRTS